MAFDGNGNFIRLYNWVTDKANAVNITASRMDGEDTGFASGLTLCVTRDGQGKMSADFISTADNGFNLGSASKRWQTLFSGSATIGVPASGTALTVNCAFTYAAINSQGSIIVGGNTLTHANQNLNTQIILQGGSAEFVTVNGSASLNNKIWSFYADPTGFYARRVQSDDYNTIFTYWAETRTGVTSVVCQYTGITGNSVVTFSPPNASTFLLNVSAGTTAGQSNGLQIVAGTNSSDLAFQVNNGANTASFFQIPGNGNVKVNASTSANTQSLTVTGQANSTAPAATFGGTAGNFISVTDGAGMILVNQASTGLGLGVIGMSSNNGVELITNSTARFTIAANGNITIANGLSFQLGSAFTGGAPGATGYVTVVDSGGTTRKLLCA